MARKRRSELEAEEVVQREVRTDERKGLYGFFSAQLAAAEKKLGPDEFVAKDDAAAVVGISLPALSLQWLLHNTGFALGRVTILIGESGSCKTALQAEMMRWHLRDPQAYIFYLETEARDSAVLRQSIIRDDGGYERVKRVPCESIEEWQAGCTNPILWMRGEYKGTAGPDSLLMMGVDSLTGVTSKTSINNIEEEGHASLTHAHDANLINTYMKWVSSQVASWPMSFVATNHIKFSMERRGQMMVKVPRIPGGDALKYHATTILMLKSIRETTRDDVAGGYELRVSTFKHSLGEKNKELEVDMVWAYGGDGKQYTTWDWHGATVSMLREHLNDKDKAYEGLGDIITFPQFFREARTVSCPQVGIRKPAPWNEVGAAIFNDQALSAALRKRYGIHDMTVYRPGVPWHQQVREAQVRREIAPVAEEPT